MQKVFLETHIMQENVGFTMECISAICSTFNYIFKYVMV